MYLSDIRDILRTIVVERGYKQNVIARKARLTPAKLSGVLNKSRRLDVNEFMAICDAMQIKPEEIMQTTAAQ